jgi:hypothetical protein
MIKFEVQSCAGNIPFLEAWAVRVFFYSNMVFFLFKKTKQKNHYFFLLLLPTNLCPSRPTWSQIPLPVVGTLDMIAQIISQT